MIGVVIATTAIGLTSYYLATTKKQFVLLKDSIDENIDVSIAERTILFDLKGIDTSFNLILDKDDSALNFYDYYPDLSEQRLTSKLSRTKTLSSNSDSVLTVFTDDNVRGSPMIYDPVAAYSIGTPPSNFNISATLTFIALNQKNWVVNQNKRIWQKGSLILLDTPARIRPTTAQGVDFQIPPRSSTFLGVVEGNDLKEPTYLNKFINRTHPATGDVVDNTDTFLRTVASVGGGQTMVRLKPILAVRYRVEKDSFIRSVYGEKGFGADYVISKNIDKVVFYREKVTNKFVQFKIFKK